MRPELEPKMWHILATAEQLLVKVFTAIPATIELSTKCSSKLMAIAANAVTEWSAHVSVCRRWYARNSSSKMNLCNKHSVTQQSLTHSLSYQSVSCHSITQLSVSQSPSHSAISHSAVSQSVSHPVTQLSVTQLSVSHSVSHYESAVSHSVTRLS